MMGFLVLVHLLLGVVDIPAADAAGGTLMRDQKRVFGRRSPSAKPEHERSVSSMADFLLSNQPSFEEEKQKLFRQTADYGPDAFFTNCDIGASPEEKALRSLLATRFRERFRDVVVVVPPLSHLFTHMAPMLCALRPTHFIVLPRSRKNVLKEDRSTNQAAKRNQFFLTRDSSNDQVPDALVRQFRAFGLLGSREAIGTWTPPLARFEDDLSSSLELLEGEERTRGGPHRADELTTQSRHSSPSPRPLHNYSFVEELSTSASASPRPADADHENGDPAHDDQSQLPSRSRRRPFVEMAEDPEAFFQSISANSSSEDSSGPSHPSRTSPTERLPLVLHLGTLKDFQERCAPPRGFCFAIGHGVDEDALWKIEESDTEHALANSRKRIFWPPRDFTDAIFRVAPRQYESGEDLRPEESGVVVPPRTGSEKSFVERPVRLLFAPAGGGDPWGAEFVKQLTSLARSGMFEIGVCPHPWT